jgi:hypothetical protein
MFCRIELLWDKAVGEILCHEWYSDDEQAKDNVLFIVVQLVTRQSLRSGVFESALLSGLAVLAINEKDGGWRTGLNYISRTFLVAYYWAFPVAYEVSWLFNIRSRQLRNGMAPVSTVNPMVSWMLPPKSWP